MNVPTCLLITEILHIITIPHTVSQRIGESLYNEDDDGNDEDDNDDDEEDDDDDDYDDDGYYEEEDNDGYSESD